MTVSGPIQYIFNQTIESKCIDGACYSKEILTDITLEKSEQQIYKTLGNTERKIYR